MKLLFHSSLIVLILGLMYCRDTCAQGLTISGNGNLNLTGTVKLRLSGTSSEFKLNDNSGFKDDNNTSLILEGDLDSDGVLLNVSGTLQFNGSANHELSAISSINTLIVNTTGEILIEGPVVVSNNLNFTQGKITTVLDNDLTLLENINILGAGTDKFVEGPLRIRANGSSGNIIRFPIGIGSSYKPLRLRFDQQGATGLYVAEVYDSDIPTNNLESSLQSVSTAGYWAVRSDESVSNAYIELPVDTEDGLNNVSLARIAKEESGRWANLGGINLTAIPGTLRSSASFTLLGNFIIATAVPDNINPAITAITPDSGVPSDVITITGTNLGNTTGTIKFGDVTVNASDIVSWTATQIEVRVPAGLSIGNSVNIEVTTNGANTPINFTFIFEVKEPVSACDEFSIISFPKNTPLSAFNQQAVLTAEVSNAALVNNAEVFYRGISQGVWVGPLTPSISSDNEFSIEVAAGYDDIGIEYFFNFDVSGCDPFTTEAAYLYINFPNGGIPLSQSQTANLSSGNTAADYNLFSIPLILNNANVNNVLDELGALDKTKWRLFRVHNGEYQEFNSFANFEPGRGYLLIYDEATDINTGPGRAVQVTKDNPFIISLQQGWNMIATPYLFTINWQDVLQSNQIEEPLQDFKVYGRTGYDDANGLLAPFKGAIWFSDEARNIEVSVIKDNTINGGRFAALKKVTNSLDADHWEVNFELLDEADYKATGGFGMQADAAESKDQFDGMLPPKFTGTSDFYFNHPEFFYPYFAKDIVPIDKSYKWNFEINPAEGSNLLTLQWKNHYFGENDKQLYLFDEATGFMVDMRKSITYSFNPQISKKFSVFYGENIADELIRPVIGNVYPNPLKDVMNILLSIPPSDKNSKLSIQWIDLSGKRSGKTELTNLDQGFQEITLDKHNALKNMSSGIYALQFVLESGNKVITKHFKVVVE